MTALARKKRQHHVWKHFLRSWEVDGRVTCLMDGRVFSTDPVNLAVEGDFYRFTKLDPADIDFIRRFVIDPATHPSAKRNHEALLRRLTTPDSFVDANRSRIANIEDVEAALDMFRTNILEELHAGTEERFKPLLDRLLASDTGFYYEKTLTIDFLHYLCMQHMRTKGIKAATVFSLRSLSNVDVAKMWSIISQMFSVKIGASLYLERCDRKLVLLENRTDTDFITGDQPTLNLSAGSGKVPDSLVFYYPISPMLALILTETDGRTPLTNEGLTSDQVRDLNARMAKAAHSQIYGRSEASVRQAHADGVESPAASS